MARQKYLLYDFSPDYNIFSYRQALDIKNILQSAEPHWYKIVVLNNLYNYLTTLYPLTNNNQKVIFSTSIDVINKKLKFIREGLASAVNDQNIYVRNYAALLMETFYAENKLKPNLLIPEIDE